jgi:hypothetical protein
MKTQDKLLKHLSKYDNYLAIIVYNLFILLGLRESLGDSHPDAELMLARVHLQHAPDESHVAGALKRAIGGDGTLRRMLRG